PVRRRRLERHRPVSRLGGVHGVQQDAAGLQEPASVAAPFLLPAVQAPPPAPGRLAHPLQALSRRRSPCPARAERGLASVRRTGQTVRPWRHSTASADPPSCARYGWCVLRRTSRTITSRSFPARSTGRSAPSVRSRGGTTSA